jgi:hypothetical protein
MQLCSERKKIFEDIAVHSHLGFDSAENPMSRRRTLRSSGPAAVISDMKS